MLINLDLSQITASDTIVLANNRQILALKRSWQQQKGTTQLPRLLSWGQYLRHTWNLLNPNTTARVISTIETRHLFARVMRQLGQKTDAHLLDEVVKNYNYCRAHLISTEQLRASHLEHTQTFATWLKSYQQYRQKSGLLDVADLSDLILNHPHASKLQAPYLYGFKTLTPEQQKLFSAIGSRSLTPKKSAQHSTNRTFQTTNDEIYQAANWAKAQHQTDPNQQIAIVYPNLNQNHHELSAIFDQVFADTLVETGQKSYNISLGKPLTDYPIIQNILCVLALSHQIQHNRINALDFNALIISPYLKGAHAEQSARALLVNRVLKFEKTHLTLAQLAPHLKTCPRLNTLIHNILALKNPSQQTHSDWRLSFQNWLTAWGFGSDRTLSSVEYQLLNKYRASSLGLNQLTLYEPKTRAQYALQDLRLWLSQIIFQAQAAKTPIQILGSLEAEGLYFDVAWVLNMTQDFLPAPLNVPRFIPFELCAVHQIPHSSYELIQTDGENTLDNLYRLADNVIFSYAKVRDESEIQPSPLIEFSENVEIVTHPKPAPIELETIADNSAPALTNLQVKRGVNILKSQMACAFKGFAQRLEIEVFQPPHIGFNRAEQGNLTHKVLENFYQTIRSQTALLKLSEPDLQSLITNAIEQVLSFSRSSFAPIEKARLSHLMTQFTNAEKTRPDFSIIATEQTHQADIAGLRFTTRIDRIDTLDGEPLIFDYKIGKPQVSHWCGANIQEPQLPIYALNQDVAGIAFIELSADKITYKGLSKNTTTLFKASRSCASWEEQRLLWRAQLTAASRAFQQGEASVLPVKGGCEYCPYELLCRVEK